MKRLMIAAAIAVVTVAGCGTGEVGGSGAPTSTLAPAPTTRAVPTVVATTSPYSPSEQAFLRAYVSTNPAASLTGAHAICTSVQIGIDRPTILNMMIDGPNKLDPASANKVFDAAITHLCPQAQVKTEPAGPSTTIAVDGTYEVGVDIAAGKWKTTGGAQSNCYWARHDQGGDIIDNDTPGASATVTVKAGELFKVARCGAWQHQG